MSVPSFAFLAFAAVAALAINCSNHPRRRSGVWLVANLAFFASFAATPGALVPFATLLLCAFASMRIVRENKRRGVFVGLLVLNTAAFCELKRYAFVPHGALLEFAYVTVGLSYVFFRLVHLIVDAYQDTLPELGIVEFVNYTLNFTAFVAGPIQRYDDYRRSEERSARRPEASVLVRASERIVFGFAKVAVASPLLAYVHDRATQSALDAASPFAVRVLAATLSIGAFPLALYANFSGYTDVVIGTARFLRLELPENFDRPFASRGFIEFWGRWHITLGAWVQTYVYSPLFMALMRRFRSRRVQPFLGVFAYFVAFFLVGMWHGQSAMFVVYGVLLGAGVSVNKLFQILASARLGRERYRALTDAAAFAACSRGVTYAWFAIAAIWFWAAPEQLASAASALGIGGIALALSLLVVGAIPAIAVARFSTSRAARIAGARATVRGAAVRAAWVTALVVVTLSITVVVQAPAPQIVYRAF